MQIKPFLFVPLMLALPSAAQEAPLSAIDWLSIQRNAPPVLTQPDTPVAQSANVPDVEVMPLDDPGVGGVGLLPSSITGLPPSLWQGSEESELIALIEQLGTRKPTIPALDSLLHTLLLAEAAAPSTDSGEAFLAARIASLQDHGLVAPAEAMVERVGNLTPTLFDQAFDLALLTGSDAALCGMLDTTPALAPDLETLIWCATRDGDYSRAMTIYQTADALGQLSDLDSELLLRFLDPEYGEASSPLRPPVRPTPLQFRLFEAIGEALPTAPLPLPFATVELSGDAGWRAQLQAAERLARAGAIDDNQLLGVYTSQMRAASGGIWDRVEALQRFETALTTGDPGAVSSALETVWPQMRTAGLLLPFSNLFASRLQGLPLSARAKDIAALAGLLSADYETVARGITESADANHRFLAAVATGTIDMSPPPNLPHAAALLDAWSGRPQAPEDLSALPSQNRLGEALLRSIQRFESGASGNDADVTEALRALRAFGLEDVARRSALQLAILDMEGARR